MRFTVTWRRSARDELAQIWLNAKDRRAVSEAANLIDLLLATDPGHLGEDFYGDRLLIVPPLAVAFAIRLDDRIAEIQQVWHGQT